MSTWKVTIATAAIFSTGFFAGVLVPRSSSPGKSGGAPSSMTSPLPNDRRISAVRSFTRDLGLTAEQHEQIDALIDESQERTRVMWDLVAPEVQEEFKRLRAEVVSVLTPEQRKRFEERSRRYRQQRSKESSSSSNTPASLPISSPVRTESP
ncbi:MAG: hypothetical protein FJ405_17695 [Verrucomicrobia bacterium]|nr:hypothetical protein [Verrucomicrobiota bacterium]